DIPCPGPGEEPRAPEVAGEAGLLFEALEERKAVPSEPDPDPGLVVLPDDRPAMASRARADVILLDKDDVKSASGEVERGARPHTAAPDDHGVRPAGNRGRVHGHGRVGRHIEVCRFRGPPGKRVVGTDERISAIAASPQTAVPIFPSPGTKVRVPEGKEVDRQRGRGSTNPAWSLQPAFRSDRARRSPFCDLGDSHPAARRNPPTPTAGRTRRPASDASPWRRSP